MGTRIEILKNGTWIPLRLRTNSVIKYNSVINRIGKLDTREISHTNTFSLPRVWQNTNSLGINVFSAPELARALNTKYQAKYYVEDKLLQSGFLVINNTFGASIQVNFIDESLTLTELWGSTTYPDLLKSNSLAIPADYQTVIDSMRAYDMDKNAVLTPLAEVGVRGYHLALFPNTLNTIGDKFQLNSDGVRTDDYFNPYQSRPIFNMKSLFDLCTEAFGYTPTYDPSVDWAKVESTYMVDSGQDKNEKDEGAGSQTINWDIIPGRQYPYYDQGVLSVKYYKTVMVYPTEASLRPIDIANFDPPSELSNNSDNSWNTQNCVFKPIVDAGNVGTMTFTADIVVDGFNTNNWKWH